MVAVPVFPLLVAVMFAVPAATPVTTPDAETVATAVLLEVQVTACPVITLLFASRTVAAAADVAPFAIDVGVNATETVATAGVTVIVAAPVTPPLVAVMLAVPTATAVTTPVAETVATAELLDAQVTGEPVIGLPSRSRGVATAVAVDPVVTDAGVNATDTELTGCEVTVTVALPVWPPLVAVMVAVPEVTPATRPAAVTVATCVLVEFQVTVRPVRTLPAASRTVATAFAVLPVRIEVGVKATVTDATAAGGPMTDRVTVLETPPALAVITAVPVPIAVISPAGEMVATALFELLHVIGVEIVAPFAPTGTAHAVAVLGTVSGFDPNK